MAIEKPNCGAVLELPAEIAMGAHYSFEPISIVHWVLQFFMRNKSILGGIECVSKWIDFLTQVWCEKEEKINYKFFREAKGQLISECPFDVSNFPKKPTKIWQISAQRI